MKRFFIAIAVLFSLVVALALVPGSASADSPQPPTAPTPVATWPAKPPRPSVAPAGGGASTPWISTTQVISTNVVEIRGSNLLPSEDQYGYIIGYGDNFPWGYPLASSSKWDTNVLTWTASLIQFSYPCVPFTKGQFYMRIGDWSSAWFDYEVTTTHVQPYDVVLSNLTDQSATISFLTKEETCSIVAYWATDKDRLSDMHTASNWVAWPTSREHWSRIGWGELEAQKAYNFNLILNGWVAYTGTFTTTVTPPLSLPNPAYGYVYLRNSSTPVRGALVYLTYTVGVTPAVLSTFTIADGSWIIDRSSSTSAASKVEAWRKLRTQDDGSGNIHLSATSHLGKAFTTLPSDYSYWPYYLALGETKTVNIRLGAGWNSIALPVEPSNYYYRISDLMTDSGNAISGVYMYGTSGWTGTVIKNGRLFGDNASLWSGIGMMVSATKPATITITGYVPTSNTRYLLRGWNFVSWAVTSTTTASDVSDDAGKIPESDLYYIKEVDRWIYGRYEGHVSGYTFNDFTIEPDKGYFVFARRQGRLTPGQSYQQP